MDCLKNKYNNNSLIYAINYLIYLIHSSLRSVVFAPGYLKVFTNNNSIEGICKHT